MPTLAAVLIFAAIGSIRRSARCATVFRSRTHRSRIATTFVATLLPAGRRGGRHRGRAVAAAAAQPRGDGPSRRSSSCRYADGRFARSRRPSPPGRSRVIVLDVYGSLLLRRRPHAAGPACPTPPARTRPVVVLRLRGRVALGATFVVVVEDYAARVAEAGGRMYVSGVDPKLVAQLRRTRTGARRPGRDRPVRIFEATELVGGSTEAAVEVAREFVRTSAPLADESG